MNRNSKIIILQGDLNDLGDLFKNILEDLQNKNIMTQTDLVDLEDWEMFTPEIDNALVKALNSKPTLRLGSTGPYVTELQEILAKLLYYTGNIDGNFGINTENAVKEFQINNRLMADGIVGRDTWSALSSLYSPLAICEEEPSENYFLYTVVKGDNLWALSRRFGTTVDAIKNLNGLTSDLLSIGQVLRIPDENNQNNYIFYTVVKGDTLWALSRRFGTTVNAIKNLNGLTSDLLSIGQVLKIPNE